MEWSLNKTNVFASMEVSYRPLLIGVWSREQKDAVSTVDPSLQVQIILMCMWFYIGTGVGGEELSLPMNPYIRSPSTSARASVN